MRPLPPVEYFQPISAHKFKLLPVLILILVLIGFYSCEDDSRSCGCEPRSILFVLKGDYIDKVNVGMNSEKTKILIHPGINDPPADTACHPKKLINGYYLDLKCNYGVNSAYLSISKEEFYTLAYEIPADSLIYYILDKDPFLEYYESNHVLPNDSLGYDSISLNKIIRSHTIELYFDRLK